MDTNTKAAIKEAHNEELAIMNFLKKQGLSGNGLSGKGSSDKSKKRRQSGGFIMSTLGGMTRFFTAMVMINRGKSGEAIEGYVEKYFPESEKKRIIDAGKDAAKFLETVKAKRGGSVQTRSQAKSAEKSDEKRSDKVKREAESEHNIYTGEKNEKGEKHGTGKMEYKNGDVYEGQWADDLRQGKGKITFLNKSSYDGNWSKGQINGRGVYTYFNGNVYTGLFENGVPMGHGKMTYLNGDVYEGHWKKGQRHGEGKMFYKNGEFFVGKWKKDKREGEGKYVDASGNVVIEGEYEDDKAPFDVSNIQTKITKADNLIGKAGQTLDSVINSDNMKMFREKLKQVTDTLPDATTFGKYTVAISSIFSFIMYLLMSNESCEITAVDGNSASHYFFCSLLRSVYKLLATNLGLLGTGVAANLKELLSALTISVNTAHPFIRIFGYIFAAGLSGFFIIMFYFAWTYINTSAEDREKGLKKARSSSRRNSSSSSSSRKTEKNR
jgi:hypothetical protein